MVRRSMWVLMFALLLPGCAAPAGPRSSPDAELFPPTEQVEALRLPFDAYTLSLAGLYTVANARGRAHARVHGGARIRLGDH
jgi:hypothetical protein